MRKSVAQRIEPTVLEFQFSGTRPRTTVVVRGLPKDQAERLARLWETRVVQTTADLPGLSAAMLDVTCTSASGGPLSTPSRGEIVHPIHRVTRTGDELQFPTGVIRMTRESPIIHVEWRPVNGQADGPSLDLMETAMGLALDQLGVICLHAVAFQIGRNTILGVGGSEAGKSTIAAAAIRSGGRVASDDSVLAVECDGRVQIGPFRAYFSFRDATLRVLPTRLTEETTEGFNSHFLDRRFCPDNLASVLVPDQLWRLKIDRRLRTSRIRPLSQQEALVALVSSASLLTLSPRYPKARAQALSVLTGLAEGCRGFDVRLGRDMLEEPETTLNKLCGGVRAPGASSSVPVPSSSTSHKV